MKTRIEITHPHELLNRIVCKKGEIGYIDGWITSSDETVFAIVVIGDKIIKCSQYQLRAIGFFEALRKKLINRITNKR